MKRLVPVLLCGLLLTMLSCAKEEEENTLNFGQKGGLEVIEITNLENIILDVGDKNIPADCHHIWSVVCEYSLCGFDGGWLRVSYYLEQESIYVCVDENDTKKPRTATLTFNSGGNDIVYKIRQSR